MKIRPIIFSGPMILALLAGRKSQTRRLAWQKPQVGIQVGGGPIEPVMVPTIWNKVEPGDLLYVREKHWAVEREGQGIGVPHLIYDDEWDGAYPDESAPLRPCGLKFGAHPSIHMFRWASRLTLEITGTKVERLQEISGMDAVSEGTKLDFPGGHHGAYKRARHEFRDLWNSLHGKGAWDANPEVVALTFTVHKQNVDALLAARAGAGGEETPNQAPA